MMKDQVMEAIETIEKLYDRKRLDHRAVHPGSTISTSMTNGLQPGGNGRHRGPPEHG